MMPETEKLSRIETAALTDGDIRATVLNYGAVTQGLWYKDVPLILGFDDPSVYLTDTNYLGAIVGRIANRISGARFDLGSSSFELNANEGCNTLHGGKDGLSQQFWDLEQVALNEAVLSYVSPDGESGFPGEVKFEVRVCLKFPRFIYSIFARPDRPTPISVAQHNYYTLGSSEGIGSHKLKLASNRYLEIDNQGIPTGRVQAVQESQLDFTEPKEIRNVPDGVDHYFCFNNFRDPSVSVAELTAPSGLSLNFYSDQPGAQVYSAAKLTKPFFSSAGLCIEPSGYPNATNVSSFPSIIFTPENPYRQVLTLEISEGQHGS